MTRDRNKAGWVPNFTQDKRDRGAAAAAEKLRQLAASPPEFRPEFSPEGFEIMLNLLCEKTAAAIRRRQAQEQKVG